MKSLYAISVAAILVFFVACSTDDEGPEDTRPVISFQGTVTDFYSGEPIPDIGISHFSEFGCTTLLKEMHLSSKSDGSFSIVYRKDIDSLVAATGSTDFDTSYIYFNISTSDQFLIPKERKQGDRLIMHGRDGNLQPNKETVSIRLAKGGLLNLNFKDEAFSASYSLIEIAFYEKGDLENPVATALFHSEWTQGQDPAGPNISALLPAERELVMKWIAKEGNDPIVWDDYTTVAEGEDELTLAYRETFVYPSLISY